MPLANFKRGAAFNLKWLDEHQEIVATFLKEDGSGRSETVNFNLGSFPRGCSKDQARDILVGLGRLKALLEELGAYRRKDIILVTPKQLVILVDAAMAVSGDWVEALVLQEVRKVLSREQKFPHLERGRRTAAFERKAKATAQHSAWRTEAAIIWKKNPKLGVEPCAALVIKRLELLAKQKTVADAIRSGKPARSIGQGKK